MCRTRESSSYGGISLSSVETYLSTGLNIDHFGAEMPRAWPLQEDAKEDMVR